MAIKFFYTQGMGWNGGIIKYAAGYERVSKDKLLVSFARCSPNDTFDKQKARLMCLGRMEKGKCVEVEQREGKGLYETLLTAIGEHEKEVAANYGS